jgi:D-galactose 1-dehydrogenase
VAPHSIAVIGLGKISQDQHLPVIGKDPRFRLAGVVSQRGLTAPGVPTFATPEALFAAVPDLEAVAICTPPGARHRIARQALAAGKHVLLEKPPTPTVSEFDDLERDAAQKDLVIFSTWHSQYNPAVSEAQKRLAGRRIRSLFVNWKEDVRRWHPGQDWIWRVGGFGVFDPGINAMSIVTEIMPQPVFVTAAELFTPGNCDTPIAANLSFSSPAAVDGATLRAEFDWRQTGDQTWTITIVLDDGTELLLENGGARLSVAGHVVLDEPMMEYERIYERFATLLDEKRSLMDRAPFQIIADAFMVGRRRDVEPFDW